MRFNFLNGLDCPDWLLSQIAEISKMTTIKYKLLCGLVINRLSRVTLDDVDLSKYVNETLDGDSILRIMTATSYIIENAILSIIPLCDLVQELQQLGMTSEHSLVLGKAMKSMPDIKPVFLGTIAKAPAVVHIQVHGDTMIMIGESEQCKVEVRYSPAQLKAFKREMARVNTVLTGNSK